MGVIQIWVCTWLCYFSTCVDKSSFPLKTHLLIWKIGITIELLWVIIWPNTSKRLTAAGTRYSLGRVVAVIFNILTTIFQFTEKSSQTTCLHLPMFSLKPALFQNYLNLLKRGIKINKMKFNRDKLSASQEIIIGVTWEFSSWKRTWEYDREATPGWIRGTWCPD